MLDRSLLRGILESQVLHGLQEDRRFVTAGVGEDRLATWRQEFRYEVSEDRGVLTLVEDIRGENEVEHPDTLCVRFAPVEKGRIRFPVQVRDGVVGGKVEGSIVMVCRQYSCAAGEREDCGQPDAAPKLDGAGTLKVAFREVTRQGEGARPEFGPVREPLVAVEVFFIDQVVRTDGMSDAVSPVPDLDRGFGQPRKAAEMGKEPIQGSSENLSAACRGGFVGHAFLTLGGGEGRYAVAPEDVLQSLAGLVPDLARGAEGGVGYVADPTCRAAGWTDLTVEDLDDVEDGDLLRRHREAVTSVRPAAALYHVRPAKLAEDLLEEPLGDMLAAR